MFAVELALGAFAGVMGTTFLKNYVGAVWAWVIFGFVLILTFVSFPLGLIGVLAMDGCGVIELHRRHQARQIGSTTNEGIER